MQKNVVFQKNIGARVKYYRELKGLSQDEFGYVVGSDRTYISKIESGAANIGVCKLCMICEKIGITMKAFFDTSVFDKMFFESEEN